MSKEKEILFKLHGVDFSIRNIKASEVAKIQLDFMKKLEKIDKSIKLLGFKESSLCMETETEFDYPNNKEKVIDVVIEFFDIHKYKNEQMFLDVIDKESNTIIYRIPSMFAEEPLIIISSSSYSGEITNIGGATEINVHINVEKFNNKNLTFKITREQAKEWRKYLYEKVEFYAEIEHDLDFNDIKGVKIITLNLVEELDTKKVDEDFDKLVKKINDPDFTSTILKLRHED